MTDTTEGATVEGSPANTTPVVDTTAGDEQSAADETTEGGTTVGPDSMDELLSEEADDLDMDIEETLSEESATVDAEKAKPAAEAKLAETPREPAPVEGEAAPAAEPTAEPQPEAYAKPDPAQAKDGERPAAEPAEKPRPDEPVVHEAPVLTKGQQAEVYNKWRVESEELLATQHYQISDEMAADLEADAAATVPRLLSKVYLDSVTASVGHMISQLPAMIDATVRARANADASEGRFFSHWANQGLTTEHRSTVMSLGQAYRGVHPNATEEEFIRDVGAQAVVALGLVGLPDQALTQDPMAPAFTPAATAATNTGPAPKRNAFDLLAQEMESEDLDLD